MGASGAVMMVATFPAWDGKESPLTLVAITLAKILSPRPSENGA
jgi:hypothetical protein